MISYSEALWSTCVDLYRFAVDTGAFSVGGSDGGIERLSAALWP